jgi:hypothetical protein
MSQLRTYRVLPLLVGLALLFGVAAPTVQAVCAMMPDDMQETSSPCHTYEANATVLNTHQTDVSCKAAPAESHYQCCLQGETTPLSATLLLDTTLRVFAPAFAGVLLDRVPRPSVARSLLPEKKTLASSFTTTPLRQALLSTFLI